MKSIIAHVVPKDIYGKIINFQKIVNLLVSVFCSYVAFYGFFGKNHQIMDVILMFYFCFDILVTSKIDMLLHHVLTIVLLIFDINTNPIFFHEITRTILLCEVSTIFLCIYNLKPLCPRIKQIELYLKVLFFLSYSYYRIYTLTKLFLFTEKFEKIGKLYVSPGYIQIGSYTCHSLLNLYYYWYAILLKKIVFCNLKQT